MENTETILLDSFVITIFKIIKLCIGQEIHELSPRFPKHTQPGA